MTHRGSRTFNLSAMNAGDTMRRWWNQLWPLAINKPCPTKCLDPCCWSQDLPVICTYLDERSSLIMLVSVKHNLGSLPYQYMNLLPKKRKASVREDAGETLRA